MEGFTMSEKKCVMCKETKPYDEFYRNSGAPDGYQYHCKVCSRNIYLKRTGKTETRKRRTREELEAYRQTEEYRMDTSRRTKEWRIKNPEKAKAQREKQMQKNRAANAARKEALAQERRERNARIANERSRRWRRSVPGAATAHNRVYLHIKQGKLPPVTTLACVKCGKQAKHYHHHKGYAPEHKVDVIPLCVLCHRLEHAEEANVMDA
jgi:hypothetical protein